MIVNFLETHGPVLNVKLNVKENKTTYDGGGEKE